MKNKKTSNPSLIILLVGLILLPNIIMLIRQLFIFPFSVMSLTIIMPLFILISVFVIICIVVISTNKKSKEKTDNSNYADKNISGNFTNNSNEKIYIQKPHNLENIKDDVNPDKLKTIKCKKCGTVMTYGTLFCPKCDTRADYK